MAKPNQVQSVAVTAKGAELELSFDEGATYQKLVGLEEVPTLGAEGDFTRDDDIDQLTESYSKGTLKPTAFDLTFKRIGDDSTQDQLISIANDPNDNSEVYLRATYRTGDILEVIVLFNGFYMNPATNDSAKQFAMVKGQMDNAPTMSKVA